MLKVYNGGLQKTITLHGFLSGKSGSAKTFLLDVDTESMSSMFIPQKHTPRHGTVVEGFGDF